MSKEVVDILGRMQGNVLALKGMYQKLTPMTGPSNPTFEQLGPAPTMAANATHEDYTFVQKLLKEIEAQAHDASAEIDKILQVPPQPGTEPPPSSGGTPTHPIAEPPPPGPAHQPGHPAASKSESSHKK
jgi:hypothetical protein